MNLYFLPLVNIQHYNLQHETCVAIVGKIFHVCGIIISFAFWQLASMVSAVKKMKGAATYKCKFKEEWLK